MKKFNNIVNSELYGTSFCAELLGLTIGRVNQLIHAGDIEGKRAARDWVILGKELKRFQKKYIKHKKLR